MKLLFVRIYFFFLSISVTCNVRTSYDKFTGSWRKQEVILTSCVNITTCSCWKRGCGLCDIVKVCCVCQEEITDGGIPLINKWCGRISYWKMWNRYRIETKITLYDYNDPCKVSLPYKPIQKKIETKSIDLKFHAILTSLYYCYQLFQTTIW